MRTTRLGFLALPLVAISGAAWAQQESDPLQSRFSGSFNGTRLSLVVAAIHEQTHLNLVLDPAVDGDGIAITAAATNVPVGKFLADVEQQAKLARSTWCGAVVLHPVGKPPAAAPSLPAGAKLDERLTLDFAGTPFLFAVERVRSRTSVELDLTARARAAVQKSGASVTMRVYRMPLRHLVAHLARAGGLSVRAEGERVVFDATGASERSVDAGTIELRGEGGEMVPRVDVARLLGELRTPGGREGARRQLAAAGKQAAGPVAAALADADEPTAIAALQVLQEVGDASHADAVLAVFRDTDRSLDVRAEAGVTLGVLKATKAISTLVDALDDAWFGIAEAARAALVEIGEPTVGPLVARYQQVVSRPQGQDWLLYRALMVMGGIGNDRCKQVLLEALQTDRGPRAMLVRQHAAIALGFTQDTKMIEPLLSALDKEQHFPVANSIARSLSMITDQRIPPQPERWRSWWAANRDRILEPQDDLYDPIELPKGPDGLPLLGD